MLLNNIYVKSFFVAVATIVLSGCSQENVPEITINDPEKATAVVLDVYKSPSCGCCKKWLAHLAENNFHSKVFDRQDLSTIKQQKGIKANYRSCHTAVSKDGFVFEGHVPAKYIQQFLAGQHAADIIGLSVPAMPLGSPGMEVDDKFMPYQILLLKRDGTSEVYARITAYAEQF